MNRIKILGFLMLTFVVLNVQAQTDKATTARIIDQKEFVFVATMAMPMNSNDINRVMSRMAGNVGGGTINLAGSEYDLRIKPDTVVAYLPYYGRAFSAPYNPDESGIKFTSKDYTYTSSKGKKGWDIVIATKDVRENVRMTLRVSESGYATLNVVSPRKQPISFNGYLKESKKTAN